VSDERPISRRELLRGRFLGTLADRAREEIAQRLEPLRSLTIPSDTAAQPDGPASASTSARHSRSFPILRPPGAIEEQAFLAGCTRCNACIEACPYQAIIHAPPRFRHAAGTPMIDPVASPCMMCPDTPCISACEPRVLRRDLPLQMGTARVDVTECLAHQHSFCSVCWERCPVPGAIEVREGKPRIVEEHCTGCGVCQHVCPAPHNAILLMPVPARPLPPTEPPPSETSDA
jgi:MauM/NapG family ferredoxin protein